ncbi:hypothetical protein Dimus_033220 [Dionaea muscipula]
MFASRDLVYKTACREFYRNLTVNVYGLKKEVACSKVRGVKIEFDGMTLASILDIPGNSGLCNYMKEVFEKSKIFEVFEVPLDDKKGQEPVKTEYFEETFLGMSQLKREDGVWWLGTGANHRRDDVEEEMNEEENAAENVEVEQENSEKPVGEDNA